MIVKISKCGLLWRDRHMINRVPLQGSSYWLEFASKSSSFVLQKDSCALCHDAPRNILIKTIEIWNNLKSESQDNMLVCELQEIWPVWWKLLMVLRFVPESIRNLSAIANILYAPLSPSIYPQQTATAPTLFAICRFCYLRWPARLHNWHAAFFHLVICLVHIYCFMKFNKLTDADTGDSVNDLLERFYSKTYDTRE